jgi:RND family efflux transporter MFP subunit
MPEEAITLSRPQELLMKTRLLHQVSLCFVLAGGATCLAADPASAPPEVPVSQPLVREVTDYEDYTGRTEAASQVELRARVSGYLDKILFKDGADVKKGDLLLQIDPRPYQAELEKAEARLALSEAQLKRAEVDFKRATALMARQAITREEFEKFAADRAVAELEVRAVKAACDVAKLNLAFTKVTAPIDGRISRRFLDAGNVVKADETALGTLVSLDPMYVYFNVDERTALRMRRAAREGKAKEAAGVQVAMGLADEKGFPHRGKVDLADNRVDPKTGTLRMRAVLPNSDGPLVPGLFVRVRLTTGEPHKVLLVPDGGVERIGRGENLLIVSAKNVVQLRDVETGLGYDGLVVIKTGVEAGDWVVLDRSEKLRPGMTVKPRKVAMPEEKSPVRDKKQP